MYNRFFVDICGMFNIWHFLTMGLFFVLLALFLFLSRKLTPQKTDRVLTALALITLVAEVAKISLRIARGQSPDSWVPLYYCSLYLFAVWFIRLPGTFLRRTGYAFITMGGILAGISFTVYPSTSLGMYPLFSAAVLHSFFYHLIMCYSGILILWKSPYRPRKRDSVGYFLFVFTACLLALFCNARLGTNCMFLGHPFELPVLQPVLEFSRLLYVIFVILAQSCAMFWVNYGLYCALPHRHKW